MASPPLRHRTRTETDQRTTHSANSPNAAPTKTRQAEPTSPHSASQQPYDEENSDDPRDGCPQPHECSGHGDLGLDGTCFAGEGDGDETQDHVLVIAFEPSDRSSNLSADQPDGARPVRRQDRDLPLVRDRFICAAQREPGHRAYRRFRQGAFRVPRRCHALLLLGRVSPRASSALGEHRRDRRQESLMIALRCSTCVLFINTRES